MRLIFLIDIMQCYAIVARNRHPAVSCAATAPRCWGRGYKNMQLPRTGSKTTRTLAWCMDTRWKKRFRVPASLGAQLKYIMPTFVLRDAGLLASVRHRFGIGSTWWGGTYRDLLPNWNTELCVTVRQPPRNKNTAPPLPLAHATTAPRACRYHTWPRPLDVATQIDIRGHAPNV
jgi:hypothetical protein